MDRTCDYSDFSPPPSSDDFEFLRQRLQELEQRLEERAAGHNANTSLSTPTSTSSSDSVTGVLLGGRSPSSFPSIFFLDADEFEYRRFHLPKAYMPVPLEILTILGDAAEVQAVVGAYFTTVHTWLPFVSKKRLYQNLTNPLAEPGADLALLFVCMKLITQRPPEGAETPHTSLYWTAKQFYNMVKSNGIYSVHLVQAAILITLYEIGHAIYPAAYLSAGCCARLGHAMGLHNRNAASQMLRRPSTWTEQEEIRRIWWAVIILDRS